MTDPTSPAEAGWIAHDSDSLEKVIGALSLLHDELRDGSRGSLGDFRAGATLPVCGQWGFGDPSLSRSVNVAAGYHREVASAVTRSYTGLLASLDGLISGLRQTVDNQRKGEEANLANVNRLARHVDAGPSAPPAPPAPPAPTGQLTPSGQSAPSGPPAPPAPPAMVRGVDSDGNFAQR